MGRNMRLPAQGELDRGGLAAVGVLVRPLDWDEFQQGLVEEQKMAKRAGEALIRCSGYPTCMATVYSNLKAEARIGKTRQWPRDISQRVYICTSMEADVVKDASLPRSNISNISGQYFGHSSQGTR